MAQPHIARLQSIPAQQPHLHRHTLHDFVFQHSTALFAPGGVCSRLLELEHQILTLSTRLLALENAQQPIQQHRDEKIHASQGQLQPNAGQPGSFEAIPPAATVPVQEGERSVKQSTASTSRAIVGLPKRTRQLPATSQNARQTRSLSTMSQTGTISRPPKPVTSVTPTESSKSGQSTSRKRRRVNSKSENPTGTAKADSSTATELIGCDSCIQWFHIDCAGVLPDDPRLSSPDVPFLCSSCAGGNNKRTEPANKDRCGLPGCTRPIENEGEFTVERVVGKRMSKKDGKVNAEFLIKWEGYSISEADWISGDGLGSSFHALCGDFDKQIASEQPTAQKTAPRANKFLLQEAIDAGWT